MMAAPSAHPALIKVSAAWRLFGPFKQDRALAGVDVELFSGDFLCLAGPSGSGKTTLLNLMGVLDLPSQGRVEVLGQATGDLSLRRRALLRRGQIGFIFQSYNLIPVLTVFENVEYPLILAGRARREREDLVNRALAAVGIAEHRRKRPGELSGGQQQRVAVARAIAGQPPILLADEPTGNLDSKTGAALLDLLCRLNEEHGITMAFSSHDPAIIRRARRIVILRDGLIGSQWHEREGTAGRDTLIREMVSG